MSPAPSSPWMAASPWATKGGRAAALLPLFPGEELFGVATQDLVLLRLGQPVEQLREIGRLRHPLRVREVRPHDQAVHVGEVARDLDDVVLRVRRDPDVPLEDLTRPLVELAADPG